MRRAFPCACCGKDVDIDLYPPSTPLLKHMCQEKLCYECAYWQTLQVPEDHLVINNTVLTATFTLEDPFAAIIKRRKYILSNTGKTILANSVMVYGEVPEQLRHLYPNNATYISRKLFYIAKNNEGFQCRKYGCLDRYHCLYFNPDIENKNGGPWNKIPANYKPGWENCPSFINKQIFNSK